MYMYYLHHFQACRTITNLMYIYCDAAYISWTCFTLPSP